MPKITVRKLKFPVVFLITWIGYACTYLLRKPIGVLKSNYAESMKLTNFQLGGLDLAMLLSYAIFQMLFGSISDKIGPRRTFSICLFGGGLAMAPFAIYNKYWAFILMLFTCGAFQSFCWASCNTGITRWYSGDKDKSKRQTTLGYFGTSPFLGGIVGTIIAIEMMKRYGLMKIYILPSILNMLIGFIVYFGFQYPELIEEKTKEKTFTSFVQVAKHPGVISCSLAVTCLKIVRYGMYFWLPVYFEKSLGMTAATSSYLSIVFDVGAACGCFFAGHVLKLAFNNNSIIGSAVMSGMSAATLTLFVFVTKFTSGVTLIIFGIVFIGLTGALNGIPDVLLCGTVPIDLGPEKAAGAFIGFINGLGSIGATIEGPLIGFIADNYSWQGALVMMIVCSSLAGLFCLRCAHSAKKQKILKEEDIPSLDEV